MIKSCYIDGIPSERDNFPEGVYIYQPIMTCGHRALHLDSYLALLREASLDTLHSDRVPDIAPTAQLISDFLRRNGYPATMPAHVELRIYRSGEIVLLGGEVSPYPQVGLRLLMPSGTDIEYDLPFSEHHTSSRRAAAEIAKIEAEAHKARVAIRIDNNGFVCSADDAEIFIVREYSITTPQSPRSVEGRMLAKAIHRAGMSLLTEPISREMLDSADEIFYIDHRGITALGSFNGKPLMHILAEKIAKYLE